MRERRRRSHSRCTRRLPRPPGGVGRPRAVLGALVTGGGQPQVVGVSRSRRAPQTAVMDTISQNRNTLTSFIDALFTKGDLTAVDTYLAEDFVNHDPPVGVTADRGGHAGGRDAVPRRVP